MKYIDTLQGSAWLRPTPETAIPFGVIEVADDHPFFKPLNWDTHTVDFVPNESCTVRPWTQAELDARANAHNLNNAKYHVALEMEWADEIINKFDDGHIRKMPGATVGQIRAYRNALRDWIIDDVINGEAPARPV